MRNIHPILLAALLSAGCAKETADEESYLSYSFKGKDRHYTGSYQTYKSSGKGVYVTRTAIGASGTRSYLIEGMADSTEDRIQISLLTDSLVAGDYTSGDPTHYATGVQMKIDNIGFFFATIYHARKPFLVHISKHTNGRISGTFSGRLYGASSYSNPKDSAEITGTINNLEVRY